MAFGLGQAIADEFARIAALLRGGGPFSSPGSGSDGPSISPIPPSPPDGGTGGPSPSPPGTGQPPVPIGPIIDVVPVNLFPDPDPIPDLTQCPILSPADYLQLVNVQTRAQEQQGTVIPPYVSPIEGNNNVLLASATGYPLEQTDFFRFRAYGTASGVLVSFFGRTQRPDGTIAPFNFSVTPASNGTVSTLTPATGPGFLLGAAASVPIGQPSAGSVFAVGEIGRIQAGAFIPHTLLFNGQLDDKQPLSSTLASPALPTSNPTFKRVTSAGGFASSTTITVTPTPGTRVRFLYITIDCDASAVVFTREVGALLSVGTVRCINVEPATFLLAGESCVVLASTNGQTNSAIAPSPPARMAFSVPLPESVYFVTAITVLAGFFSSAAGDIASNMTVNYEET